jgi:hypothetical protein
MASNPIVGMSLDDLLTRATSDHPSAHDLELRRDWLGARRCLEYGGWAGGVAEVLWGPAQQHPLATVSRDAALIGELLQRESDGCGVRADSCTRSARE